MRYSHPKEIREAAQVEPPPGVRLWGVSPPQPLRRAVCGEMYHLIQQTLSLEESCGSRSADNPVEWPPQLFGLDEFAYAPAPTYI